MSEVIFERVVAELKSLSADHLRRLRRLLDERLQELEQPLALPITPRFIGWGQAPKDRTKENEWLAQHRDEYAGQWVALDGGRLIGHRVRFEDVAQAMKKSGIKDALVLRVEGSNAPPFAGV